MKKVCELCKSVARIYCESDEASLCWNCDFNVHSANFLVAKHSRNLLCHKCQCPTAWNASGEKLGRTISVCEQCVPRREERQADNENEIVDEEEEGESAGDVCKGDNQVVPISETTLPPAASSSSSSGESSNDRDNCLKRLRQNSLDLCSEDDLDCASSEKKIKRPSACVAAGKAAFANSLHHRIPSKVRRTESNQSARVHHQRLAGSKLEAVLLRFRRNTREGPKNRRSDDCDSSVSS